MSTQGKNTKCQEIEKRWKSFCEKHVGIGFSFGPIPTLEEIKEMEDILKPCKNCIEDEKCNNCTVDCEPISDLLQLIEECRTLNIIPPEIRNQESKFDDRYTNLFQENQVIPPIVVEKFIEDFTPFIESLRQSDPVVQKFAEKFVTRFDDLYKETESHNIKVKFKDALTKFVGVYDDMFSEYHLEITQAESGNLEAILKQYLPLLSQLNEEQCKAYKVDIEFVRKCLTRYQSLEASVIDHNYIVKNSEYLDDLVITPNARIHLNYEQRRAIIANDKNILLIAGAGTGKTLTIAAKVKYLLDKNKPRQFDLHDILPKEILIITHTNAGVNEIKTRLNKFKLSNDSTSIDSVQVSTIHSFAKSLMKNNINYVKVLDKLGEKEKVFFDAVKKLLYSDNELLQEVIHYLGDYFTVPLEAMEYIDLDSYHLAKAEAKFETLRSLAKDFIQEECTHYSKRNRAIKGEIVRSQQEAQIANFLYLHSIEYEYEPTYKQNLPSSNKPYTPDFLIDNRIYLEHWALNEKIDNNINSSDMQWKSISTVLSEDEIKRYYKRIKDKRVHHEKNGTVLIETWSKYREGSLLDHLEKLLISKGIELRQRDFRQIYDQITQNSKEKYVRKLLRLLREFIELFLGCGYDKTKFKDWFKEHHDNIRTKVFLDISSPVFDSYISYLDKNNMTDYENMINKAVKKMNNQRCFNEGDYKYIIVDEFQDTSRQQFELIKALCKQTTAKLFAVGDDWQSIFGFNGSEIDLFTHFCQDTGGGKIMEINKTFRNCQEVIDIAGSFIKRNTAQFDKQLISSKKRPDGSDEVINILTYTSDDDLRKQIFDLIKKLSPLNGEKTSIGLLGRYKKFREVLCKSQADGTKLFFDYDEKTHSIAFKDQPKTTELFYRTIHSAKGLEFDNVIILAMAEGRRNTGFPCPDEDDPILDLVKKKDLSIEFAEERRLFYVALTRTRNRVYIFAPLDNPSRFLSELNLPSRPCRQ